LINERYKLKNVLGILLPVLFFSTFILSLSKPINDPDLFWHIKTGEWIWQNKTLPDSDPFTFTVASSEYETSVLTSFALRQYWLSQLLLYGSHKIAGFYGIIALRCLVYLGIVLILYFWMGRKGIDRINRLLFLLPMFYWSIRMHGDRPNIFSLLFAVIVVYLLEEFKGGHGKHITPYIFLPLSMLLWANMHGGFIFGNAVIILYMIAEGIKRMRAINARQSDDSKQYKLFFTVCLISVMVSFLNPNIYKVYKIVIEPSLGELSTEFLGPLYYASLGKYYYLIFIGIMVLPILLKVRQLTLSPILVLIFFTILSFRSIRFIPFLIFISTPFIAQLWTGFFDKIGKRYMAILIFGAIAFFFFTNIRHTVFLKNNVISPLYPDGIVRFIKTERPEPKIFNDFSFGGYLIWSLYPDYKVFIDGRVLSNAATAAYRKSLSGSIENMMGIPGWKAIFNAYDIKMVITWGTNFVGGEFVRLVRRLIEDNEWHLVFIDKEALLFIKDTNNNKEIIKRHSKPKMLAYEMALRQAEIYRFRFSKNWNAYMVIGEINLYMGRPKIALKYFETATAMQPLLRSTKLNDLIIELRAGRDYRKFLDSVFNY
jgi:hypothetical protein